MPDKNHNNNAEPYSLVKAIVAFAMFVLFDSASVIGAFISVKKGYKVFGIALLIADIIFKIARKATIYGKITKKTGH